MVCNADQSWGHRNLSAPRRLIALTDRDNQFALFSTHRGRGGSSNMAGIEVMEGSRKHARREKQPAYEFLVKRRKFIGLFKEAQICFLRTWGYVSRQTTLVSLVVLRRYARYDRLCVLSRSSMCAIVLSRVIRRPCEWVTLKCH